MNQTLHRLASSISHRRNALITRLLILRHTIYPRPTSMPRSNGSGSSRGIFFIAFGKKYVDEACYSARSIKKSSNLNTAICCDSISGADRSLFDNVEIIRANHSRSKIDFLDRSPFEFTLYLDSDTEVVDDISEAFDLLDKYDLCFTHDFARKRYRWAKAIPEYSKVPDGFSELGGGVIFYRLSSASSFINLWRKYFYKNFDTTNGWDQASLRIAAWQTSCRIYVLPPEYNVRAQKVREKTDTLPDKEGGKHPMRPRILHWHGLSDPDCNVEPYRF